MNNKQFEIWKKQKIREYMTELEELQNNLAKRGMARSGFRNKAEENLKARYDSEIEIKRLEVEEEENNKARMVGILNKGKNSTIIGNIFQNLSIGIQDEGMGTRVKDNIFSKRAERENDLYKDILEWANSKTSFSEQELFNNFSDLNKQWYLNVFRGASKNEECLIGVYGDKKGSFYFSLTAKGKSAYLNSKQIPKINIEKIEMIGGDKIEQSGKKNKADINKGLIREGVFSKIFWLVIVPLLIGIILYYLPKIIKFFD